MKPIVILGSGGYAQEVLWIIDDINEGKRSWDFLGFVDPGAPKKKGQTLYDRPILGGFEDATSLPRDLSFVCGIGSPSSRMKESERAEAMGWAPVALVHPSVIAARHVEVGLGTIIGAGCILAPYAQIGRHCALNLGVTVGHNSRVSDFCVLAPGARISGNAVLEQGVFIGTNAIVYLKRTVGAGASLGAGSFLITNLAPGRTAIGIPATAFGQATGAGICTDQEGKEPKKEA